MRKAASLENRFCMRVELRKNMHRMAIKPPLSRMADHMWGIMRASSRALGFSRMYLNRGGSPLKARAARVSMNQVDPEQLDDGQGQSEAQKGAQKAIRIALTLTVI